MSGTIEPGDLLFVDISVKSFDGDGIYAFLYDDTAHVKRLQKMKDKLLVISDNKSYAARDPIEKDRNESGIGVRKGNRQHAADVQEAWVKP